MDFSLPCTITFLWLVTITFHSSWLDKILGQVMSDLYHVLLDLGIGDYHFPAVEYHIVYVTWTMLTKHSRTLRLYRSIYKSRKLSIVYTKSPMFIKQSPTLRTSSYHDNGHKKNAAKSWHNFLMYICRCLIQSYFFRYNKTNSACPSGTMPW